MVGLALLTGLSATLLSAPEVVVLPLAPEGVNAKQGVEAWKVLTTQLERARRKGKLDISTKVQKTQRVFVVGPARERARDCGANIDCLSEIGSTLGTQFLIAGTVNKKAIALLVLDVKSKRRIAKVGSAQGLKGKSLKRRARSAARNVVNTLKKRLAPQAVASAPKQPPKQPPPEDDLKGAENDLKGDPAELATPASSGLPSNPDEDEPSIVQSAVTAPSAMSGALLIPADQLKGVSKVTIDGEELRFAGDGTIRWSGAPGDHSLVATRADGNKLRQEITIQVNATTNVSLPFQEIAPSVTAQTSAGEKDGQSVFGKWWFWTSLGVAVALGATTAGVLAGGTKGGPSLPSETGTIRGTY